MTARRPAALVAASLLLGILPASRAQAFPEMVRKGYANCTTCHFSPSGGGILTEYGRELSRELLSQFSTEQENAFAYGLVKPPEWLTLGGDFRVLQTYRDTVQIREGKLIWMQQDLEAAVTVQKFTAVGTAGLDYLGDPISRRHFLLYHATDEITLRGGRFMPNYGINTDNHVAATRRGIGWDEGTESYNIEGSWISENLNVFATGIFGRPDNSVLDRESGGALNASYFLAEKYKAGLSAYHGSNKAGARTLAGPFGVLGFTPSLYLLSEVDFVFTSPLSLPSRSGAVDYQKLDYEFFQGFHGFFSQELIRNDFKLARTVAQTYTAGIQYFPRPHLEGQLAWQKQKAGSGDFIDFATLLVHFYP